MKKKKKKKRISKDEKARREMQSAYDSVDAETQQSFRDLIKRISR